MNHCVSSLSSLGEMHTRPYRWSDVTTVSPYFGPHGCPTGISESDLSLTSPQNEMGIAHAHVPDTMSSGPFVYIAYGEKGVVVENLASSILATSGSLS